MLVSAAVAVGGVGWSGHVLTLPLAILFPALWAGCPNRATAVAVSAGYFLAASRGLPQAVSAFFGASVWAGILLWGAASLAFVAVHAALWTQQLGVVRATRYGVALVLMAVPPFGIAGWAHPLTASGVLFPGWGWWGLAATMAGLLAMTTRRWPLTALAMLGAWTLSAASWTSPAPLNGWQGVDTAMNAALGRGNDLDQHRRLVALVQERAAAGAEVVVLPESALGALTPTVARLWTEGTAGLNVTVIAGAIVINAGGYDNVMAELGKTGAAIRYRARMPVPIAMWQPWRIWSGASGGARATVFANPVVELRGRRVVPLICYEQLLVWPVLQSALHRPEAIVAIGNGWWATGTSIPAIQQASVEAWARLFGLCLVTATNR
jgi:hypothetical protein